MNCRRYQANLCVIRFVTIMWTGLAFLVGCSTQHTDDPIAVESPDKDIKITFYLDDSGSPGYIVFYQEKLLFDSSRLGLILKDLPALDRNFRVESIATNSVDTTWEQPWGEEHFIRNNFDELAVALVQKDTEARKLNIVFRVFDDGFGFRYEYPEQEHLGDFAIVDELTEFDPAIPLDAWWIPAFQGQRYEILYKKSPVSELTTVHTPLTLESVDGPFLAIHEAALIDYASMTLEGDGEALKCKLVPWKNGVGSYVEDVRHSPWRTVQIADDPGGLITSYLILNLNEPSKIEDPSWIEPGKYVGIWWEMHLNTGTWHQGPKHAATTANTRKYIDFAAANGFDAVLVEGWNVGWDGQWANAGEKFRFTEPYPDYDIEYLSQYAREKGVYIIGHHETGAAVENYEGQLEDAFVFLEELGMKAVKTGYVGDTINNGEWHHGQYMVRHHQKVAETAARHHVMVVAHEPIKATGLRRTWPNFVSREAARGQEYNAWSGDGGNPPDHVTILPFTRLLAGPMDYTPGIFELTLPTQPNNQINGTLARELALYVVIYSPVQMAADLPENYNGHPAFRFIKEVPVDWETTRVLEASIGDYVTIARKERGSQDWYVGAVTDEQSRTIDVPLSFLDAGESYDATLYTDADDTHYNDNPQSFRIEAKKVTRDSTLRIYLAPGGGAAVSIVMD